MPAQREEQPAAPSLFAEAAGHHQAGRLAEAEALYRRILAADPGHAASLHLLGVLCFQSGRPLPAQELIRQAIARHGTDPAFHLNLGAVLKELGRLDEAIETYGRALALRPDYPEALNNLGNVLLRRGRFEEAVPHLRRAAELRPERAEIHNNLGNAFLELGRYEEAAACYRGALALRPNYAEAINNLGNVFRGRGEIDYAAACHRQAIVWRPDYAEARKNLGFALLNLGRQSEAAGEYEAALSLAPDDAQLQQQLLACATYRDDLDLAGLEKLHRRYGRHFAMTAEARQAPRRAPGGKLRIGYVSGDLRSHPVAFNLLPALDRHDRERFELHFYSMVKRPDRVTDQLRALATGWRTLHGLDDEQAAQVIREDGIDILVSLAGRFDENRPSIFARRAASIQISLHDVATSGLEAMDYLVADRCLIPGSSREFFTERKLRLPRFYLAAPPRDLPEIEEGGSGPPVFGCFNNPAKITPSVLALWGRVLAALPEARLELKYLDLYRSEGLRVHFLHGLTAAGAREDQVLFHRAGREAAGLHLARYNRIDAALDPFPFSGSTTSFEALCMGVPVITWPWDRMVSRWSAALLRGLRLEEWIAGSADEYVSTALAVVRDRARWRARRREIRDRLIASSFCDGAAWARRLERLYLAVWRRHLGSGGTP